MLNLLRRPAVSPQELGQALAELGLDGRQHVIVHASLKSFGHLDGGARAAVDTLMGASATLVAPAFTYNTLLSRPTAPVHTRYHRDLRVSRDIGRVPQEMVERADALRSFHPTLSFVALGEQADAVTQAQTLESPYRPIGALYDLDGYALLMGVDFGSNTSIHYGEYVAGVPLLTRFVALGPSVVPTAFPNCSADFGRLEPHVAHLRREVMVGASALQLYRVRNLVDTTVNLLRELPESLLCNYRGCRCQDVRAMIRKDGLHPRPHAGLLTYTR